MTEIQQAHLLLAPLLGSAAASALFAIALLASGQSSTLTGTMAGQIVMEGFLNFRMRPWLRRLITRMLAVIPAALTIYAMGEEGTYRLLILSNTLGRGAVRLYATHYGISLAEWRLLAALAPQAHSQQRLRGPCGHELP